MNVARLAIPDVLLITPTVLGDHRGYFMEVWNAEVFAAAGIDVRFVQDNQSGSRFGILRGLHYQVERPQGKLVRVVSGEVFDVAVDLRKGSATFAKWIGIKLSAENRQQLYIPPGLAHGFLVTSESAEVAYKCTDFYSPGHERTLLWNDPDLAIGWPLPVGDLPTLSAKDSSGTPLRDAELYP
jgi:dTDP-4-dehydrorhamnose 3,5-epimerase